MSDFVTLTGIKNYYEIQMLKVGQEVNLVKDYENKFDEEAIKVQIDFLETIGYIANSINTVAKGTKSAGRIYDTFEDSIKGIIRFIVKDVAIIEIVPSDIRIKLNDLIIEKKDIEGIKIIDIINKKG